LEGPLIFIWLPGFNFFHFHHTFLATNPLSRWLK
jgi:hypothetical protein